VNVLTRQGRAGLSEIRQLLAVLRAGEPEADGGGQRLPQPGLAAASE